MAHSHVLTWMALKIGLCEGKKVPQSPKPQKIKTNDKVTKSDYGGRPESNEKVPRK